MQHHYERHWKGWALKIESFLGPEMARVPFDDNFLFLIPYYPDSQTSIDERVLEQALRLKCPKDAKKKITKAVNITTVQYTPSKKNIKNH